MTEPIRSPRVRELCELAANDQAVLRYPLPDEIYGFHAQQSCEKLLKALIAASGEDYPFTHDLSQLEAILLARGEDPVVVPYELSLVTPFASKFRYAFSRPLDEEERTGMLRTVEVLREQEMQEEPAL